MRFSYTVFIHISGLMMRFLARFNPKAEKWVAGRKNWKADLERQIDKDLSYCWIHCASAGEFEQAVPIMGQLRKTHAELRIAVSFFSPSGFEMYKESQLADAFFYFPMDTRSNAIEIIELIRPKLVVFVRNEIWWNILSVLKRKQIPAFLVNANLQQSRNFFYRKYLDRAYPMFTKIFDTANFGNTKMERVVENKQELFQDDVLENFCRDSFVLILGSSWTEEEKIAAAFYKKNNSQFSNLKIIIAPHESDGQKKEQLENLFGEKITAYTQQEQNPSDGRILLLDKKGILKYAYRYAAVAFIGGGLGRTVHNIAESAVYSIPTLFGPHYEKFEEANDLVKLQVAFPVRNTMEFEKIFMELMSNAALRNSIKEKLENYFAKQEGTSARIVADIFNILK